MAVLGLADGALEGADVGLAVDGLDVGAEVGNLVGAEVGSEVGLDEGAKVGREVGFRLGANVLGLDVGARVMVGLAVEGCFFGWTEIER